MTRRRLSQHFTIEEFDSRDGVRVPAECESGLLALCAWWLEPIRDEFGPVHIASGFRSLAHNSAIGGARASVHMGRTSLPRRLPGHVSRAMASDVTCRRGDAGQWQTWALRHVRRNAHLANRGRGGVGYYPSQGFVHLDTGPQRTWIG